MRVAGYVGGLLGLTLLFALVLRADLPAMLQTVASAGWPLSWLIPYRSLYFLLYALGWFYLLRFYDPQRRAALGYLFWVTSVREAIDRLLPVASVGGGVAGVRLLRWRGLPGVPVSATVIVEIVLTLIVSYAFTALGLLLLLDLRATGAQYHRLLLAFLISLPAPAVTVLLLRYGSVFKRLQKFLSPLVGASALSEDAAALDQELRACLGRWRALLAAGILQFAALSAGSFEIWFALRLFGHPVDVATALILESMTQTMRHVAFMVPASLGVQEATLVLFGHSLGISSELALAVSMTKRAREVLCGLPSLISWQWMEGRRLRYAR
ncbi:MAG: lysylphosphatidylglycerol synthase domain-containing protein [Pseudomonadota bacterium]|nr:lysylphosphatidylglycerol synthase domain-containing protein [Pseudomonadota bacterium]